MISVIICSRKKIINEVFIANIENTIGCAYELIVIDNSEKNYSIFEAYNLGIEKSNGEYLCFIHDDILFHSQNWGMVINEIFESDDKIGLIGVAGAKVKTKMPSGWWNNFGDQNVIYIIQHFKNTNKKMYDFGFEKDSDVKVAVVDGVFMAMRKDKRIIFNNKIGGFHAYDLNISFEYIKYGYNAIVTNRILIEHFSSGVINKNWIYSSYKIHQIYTNFLPISIGQNEVNIEMEILNGKKFINKCFKCNLSKIAIFIWFKLFMLEPISIYHYHFWKRIVKNKLC